MSGPLQRDPIFPSRVGWAMEKLVLAEPPRFAKHVTLIKSQGDEALGRTSAR